MVDQNQGYRRPRRLFFDQVGININSPMDAPRRERRAYKMKNMSIDLDGSLTTRPGFANLYAGLVVAGQTPCHSECRISDDTTGVWARIIGTGTHLAAELSTASGSASSIDTGYSGKPLLFSSWRPSESAKLHVYVSDSSRMRKVDTSGNDKQIGLPAPISPPTLELARPYWKSVSNMQVAAEWANTGVAGAAALLGGKRINTTLEATSGAIFDSGTTGWACLRPVDLSNVGVGSLLDYVTSGPTVGTIRVAEVHRASAATTVAAILYESGSTGVCVIQPTIAPAEFTRNAVVKLDNGGGTVEYARVLATVLGINGQRCIRVRTTNTWAAGVALQVVNSFRAYSVDPLAGGDTITQEAITSTATGAGSMYLTDTVTADLTQLSAGTAAIAMTDDDYFSLSMRASDWSKVTNVRVLFDLDAGAFSGNYYYRTIEQSVLVASTKNTQTTAEITRRERQQVQAGIERTRTSTPDDYLADGGKYYTRTGVSPYDFSDTPVFSDPDALTGPSPVTASGEAGTGDNQWAELRWRRRDCLRSGGEQSKNWKDVVAVRIEATVTAAVTIVFNSLNVSGGFGPDVGERGSGYRVRYRGRDSTTGVMSDYSPETLEEVFAYRDRLAIALTQHPSPEVDQLDIERWGGYQSGWLIVGSVANSATPTFTSDLPDFTAESNATFSDMRSLQPWVRFDSKKSGTASTVAGNLVRDNGSNALSTSIVPGTRITVGGIATSIRRMVGSSATTLTWELADSVGAMTNAAWEIAIPVIAGQSLAPVWRHDSGTTSTQFACDGIYLRWSLGQNPDATRATNVLEVTESSDPLVMGFSHDGRCGVFSTRSLFWVTGDPVNGFRADKVENSKGLYDRYCLATGDRVAWLSGTGDSICASLAGDPESIIDHDLAPLFVGEEGGGAPTSINGVRAPKIASSELGNLRLSFADDGSLFFMYRDVSANRGCLRYVARRDGWLPYEFAKPLIFVHAEEGTSTRSLVAGDADGKLHLIGGSSNPVLDDGTGFAWEVQPFAENFGDARPNKRIGDMEIDANPNGQTINVEIGYNNHTTTTTLATITGASQVQRLYDLSSGDGTRARNVSLRLSGTTSGTTRPRLYSWEPSVLDYPADTILRASQKTDAGYAGDKYMQGIVIQADTYGQPKTLKIKKDDGTVIDTITITHNGERRESYSFDVTNDALRIARLVWIATEDTDPWTLIDWQWVYNREPAAAKVWEIQYTGVDARDYFHVFQILLTLTSSADTTMETYVDGTLLATNTIASTAGVMLKTTPIVLPARTAKLVKWRFESTADLRLYLRDCAIWIMPHAGSEYSVLRPFGGQHRDAGAEI